MLHGGLTEPVRPARHGPRGGALLAAALAALTCACDRTPGDPTTLVRSLALTPDTVSLLAGGTAVFAVTASDAGGHALQGVRLTWRTADNAIARVDSSGRVTAVSAGATALTVTTASLGGQGPISASAMILVSATAVVNCASRVAIAGAVIDTATWAAAGGPYCMDSTVVVSGRLTIQPGARVYAAGRTRLLLGDSATLVARGTASEPILLAASDPVAGWVLGPGGCPGSSPTVTLTHVQLNGGEIRMGGGSLEVDSASVRGGGFTLCATSGRIRGSTLENAELGLTYGGTFTVDGTSLRGAGILCGRDVRLHLRNTRIEGASGPAINFWQEGTPCSLAEASGVRLLGNASIARMTGPSAQVLLTEPGAADSLAGNVRDAIVLHHVTAFTVNGELVLPPFEYESYGLVVGGKGALRLGPGTRFLLHAQPGDFTLVLGAGVRMIAVGTSSAPVTFAGPGAALGGAADAPSRLVHVRVEDFTMQDGPGRPLYLDSARGPSGRVVLSAPGSRVTASVFDSGSVVLGAGDTLRATVVRNSYGAGIRIEGAAVVDSCEVTGSRGDGIVVTNAAGASIHHCNLHDNAGAGVRNDDAATLDARFNWWGDAAGPNGPAGDGVTGPVDWSGALGSAVLLAMLLRLLPSP